MRFEEIKTRGYVTEPTPLQRLEKFSKECGEVEIFIKRDDLLPFGGNKTRKMDYLMQEAVDAGADTVITASTNQCCHNAVLLMAANKEGMKTQVIMESWGDPSYDFESSPEKEMYRLASVERVETITDFPSGPVSDIPLAEKMAEDVRKEGRTPWFISRGGAGPLGSCGYVKAAYELKEQWGDDEPDAVVCPCGIGGTQAGLIVGLERAGSRTKVYGIGVTGKSVEAMETSVLEQCREITDLLEMDPIDPSKVCCVDGYSGDGYSKPFKEQYEVMKLLASTEGIMTDAIYSGKTAAGLYAMVKSGIFRPGEKVVFLHTGGMNLYYDYHTLSKF